MDKADRKKRLDRIWLLAKAEARSGVYEQARRELEAQYKTHLMHGYDVFMSPAQFEAGLRLVTMDAYFLFRMWGMGDGCGSSEQDGNEAFSSVADGRDTKELLKSIHERYIEHDRVPFKLNYTPAPCWHDLLLKYGWWNKTRPSGIDYYFLDQPEIHDFESADTPEKLSLAIEIEAIESRDKELMYGKR